MKRFTSLLIIALLFIGANAVAQYRVPVQQGNVFTMAGYNRVDGYRWFDGNPATKFTKIDWTADWRAGDLYPNEIFVVLDSVYNITSYDVNTNYEFELTYSMFFYDVNRTQIGDSVAFNSLANGWRNFAAVRNGVRFVKLVTYQTFGSNTGLRDVQLNGTATAAASSIYPTAGSGIYNDAGVTAHGMNYIGDRFDKLDLQGDTISTKITKSIRWGELPADMDYYPDTRNAPLINGPLYLGRYTFDGFAKNFNRLKLRGHHLMMYGTGGTMKNVVNPAEVSNNNSWLGNATNLQSTRYTEAGADPRHDTSWNAKAERIYGLVRLYGGNAAATGGPTIIAGNNTAGQNNMDIFETGNEESRFWVQSYYLPPQAYQAFQKTLYNRGKQADANAKIYAPALPGFDTTYWRAVWFHHYWTGGNVNNYPADGLNFNMYLNNDKTDQNSYGTDTWAISPEKWRLKQSIAELKSFFNRFFPSKQVQWTEFGFATDDVSPYDVGPIGPKTDRQVQAEWTLRLKALTQTEKLVERMYYYSFFEDATGPFNSMAAARDSNNWINVIPQPVGYALGQELYVETNYKHFSDVVADGDSTGNWVTRKDHVSDASKKLYKVWRGTDNNSTGTITIPVAGATTAKMYTMRYDTWKPDSTDVTITSGSITVPTSELMRWVEVTTTASPPPTVSASASPSSMTLPANSTTLSSTASDPDGFISSRLWSKVSGGAATITSPASATTTVTGLEAGSYVFRMTVTDNETLTAFADVSVTVTNSTNTAPVVTAGRSRANYTNSITLEGSATDDGTIASYAWSQVSGPATVTFVAPTSPVTLVTGLTVNGEYVFRLTATDNLGVAGFRDVRVLRTNKYITVKRL